ncbi:NapC/NirT family cytochrome c [Campylobacter jejuni]|nr:NapC/NirT family cytochrome c [Campylobacter jejuni]EHN6916701.1 NapC/NirT family cytochrome c [Campylobacter jejuni]
MKKTSNLFTIFLVLLFVFFAVGFYTFYNAKGTSYLSNASESCNNCHIMNEVYNEYMAGPHSQKVKGEPRATWIVICLMLENGLKRLLNTISLLL